MSLAAVWLSLAQLLLGQNLIDNPGFQPGVAGWDSIWNRESGAGTCGLEKDPDGKPAFHIRYTGEQDWAIAQSRRIPVKPGDILRMGVSARSDAAGHGGVSVVLRSADGEVVNWAYAGIYAEGRTGWSQMTRRFVVPPHVATLQFRFEGYGKGDFAFRDPFLKSDGDIATLQGQLPSLAGLSGRNLAFTVFKDGTMVLHDKRDDRTWHSVPPTYPLVKLSKKDETLVAAYLDLATDQTWTVTFAYDRGGNELTAEIGGDGAVIDPIRLPAAFQSHPGEWAILPENEGMLYPVDDPAISPAWLVAYGGHGICMPWYGVMDPKTGSGLMSIIETPDDASISMDRFVGPILSVQPQWEASRSTLRYSRKIRIIPLTMGGYVAMAQRYRSYAREHGLLVTLAEKRKRAEATDLLIGAINVWTWGDHKLDLCKAMKAEGVEHVLWSGGGDANEIKQINAMGYLSSRYDIYQDVWDPKIALPWMPTAGWPDDLVLLKDGSPMKGWSHPDKQPDGTVRWIQGGVISSGRGLARAKQVIPAELKTIPFKCRFIDTTTASPWREDYNPKHPLARSDDRRNKMALLAFCSKDLGLVTGSETGLDASVPYLHYFEGMESIGRYRLSDAGTDPPAYRKPTQEFLKFQIGPYYRLPLWELVYHDCTVAQWYWGDATNKTPEVWDQRDLINILYGTAPLVWLDLQKWEEQKARVLRTCRNVCSWTRKVGYDAMVSHEFLTPDHTVQRTRFSSGRWCVVNFGSKPAKVGGEIVPPLGFVTH